MKIAILGTLGSFYEIATRNYFREEISLLPCDTFEELTESLVNEEADYGCLAIENSLVGSILRNYNLKTVATSIETNKENYTRFLILSHQKNGIRHHD